MRNKILVSLILLASIVTVAWTSMDQSQRSPRLSYEYQVIDDFANSSDAAEGLKTLNRLGSQGWEVVAVTTESRNYGGKVWLKRAKR